MVVIVSHTDRPWKTSQNENGIEKGATDLIKTFIKVHRSPDLLLAGSNGFFNFNAG